MEIWKPIPEYEGYYEASSTGLIRSVPRKVILKTKKGEDRICDFKGRILSPHKKKNTKTNTMLRNQIVLSVKGKTKSKDVHRLIALTFIPNESNLDTVNHKDGNPLNNNIENLEWVSRADNIRHAFKNNLIKTKKPVAKIDVNTNEVIEVYSGENEACRANGVTASKIGRSIRRNGTCAGYKWKFIND